MTPHHGFLVDLAGLWSEHGLHHELVFVLLGRVELEGLETDRNADLGVGINHAGVGFDAVPEVTTDVNIRSQVSGYLPLRSCGLYFETNFLVGWVF